MCDEKGQRQGTQEQEWREAKSRLERVELQWEVAVMATSCPLLLRLQIALSLAPGQRPIQTFAAKPGLTEMERASPCSTALVSLSGAATSTAKPRRSPSNHLLINHPSSPRLDSPSSAPPTIRQPRFPSALVTTLPPALAVIVRRHGPHATSAYPPARTVTPACFHLSHRTTSMNAKDPGNRRAATSGTAT